MNIIVPDSYSGYVECGHVMPGDRVEVQTLVDTARSLAIKLESRHRFRYEAEVFLRVNMDIIIPSWASTPKPSPLTPQSARKLPEYKEYFILALIRILFPNAPERAITTMGSRMGNTLSGRWNTHDLYTLAMASNEDQQKADQIVLRGMGVI